MLKMVISFLCVGLILLSGPQESKPQPAQSNRSAEQRSTNSQPSTASSNNSNAKIDNTANTASPSQNQERDAKDDPFKAEQLRQNERIATATVYMAVFGGLSFFAALIYAVISIKQWRAIKKQAEHAGEQVEKMQGQLDAIKEQAGIMREALAETRIQSAAMEAQMKIASIAVGVAERNAVATEQSARIALEEVRPFLTLTASVRRSDTAPEIHVHFQNSGPSKATVIADYILNIFAAKPFIKRETITPFVVHPNRTETARISEIDAREFDLVVRAGGGDLTVKIVGRYEGVGGPYPIEYCRKWVSGRDPHQDSIDGECDKE